MILERGKNAKNKDLVLTAETKDLQRFPLEHFDDDTVFFMRGDEMQLQTEK